MKMFAKQLIQVRPDEHIRLTVREYFITRVPRLTIAGLVYLAWWFFLSVFSRWGWWANIVWIIGLVLIVAYCLRLWLIWKNDCCIVTDQRLIDVAKGGVFDTTVREVAWSTVHDIQYTQRGFFAALCGYGSVTILVKEAQPIVLQHVYQPAIIRDILSEYVPTLH